MNSEKVKEIKKRLEYCQTSKFDLLGEALTLINELESENKELNNELKRYKMDWLNSEKMHLLADMEDTEFELFCANKSLGEVRKENQQHKDRIALLEKDNELLRNAKVVYETVDYCFEDLKKAEKRIAELEKVYDRQVRIINDLNIEVVKKQEKLPKFVKRLKEKLEESNCINNGLWLVDTQVLIDETLKEFVKGE